MELTQEERFHYFNLEKGYEGEVKFDRMAENLQEERYTINDLLLKVKIPIFRLIQRLFHKKSFVCWM